MTATPTRSERRARRAEAADHRLRRLWSEAASATSLPGRGAALVAVGGYGRRELSPSSDLDLLLLAADDVDEARLGGLAERLWYPLWDDGVPVDHAVRTVTEVRDVFAADLRVALGLLDVRHVAGEAELTFDVRTTLLADWRQRARRRLPLLAELTRGRWAQAGDLAHATTPDLKHGRGGLHDVTMLRALLASWLVDVPAAELDRLGRHLLEVRDALHEVTGRAAHRLVADDAPDVAEALGLPGPAALRTTLLPTGRAVAHLAAVSLRNVDWLTRPASPGPRRPRLEPLAPGVAAHRGEVVLSERAEPGRDPILALRAAHAAVSRGLVLTDAAAARLGRELAPMPVPWPDEARTLLVGTLAGGPMLVDVWESLDQFGVVDALFPEWRRVRYLAPLTSVHAFTVDRHLVQTCVEAAPFLGEVERPDLLLVAALLHDIGKGGVDDHSQVGELVAWDVAGRLGYDAADCDTVARLVRHHLLLVATATASDPEHPATVDRVVRAVGDEPTLRLLVALTRADALATGPKAWTTWRARLVARLAARVADALSKPRPRGMLPGNGRREHA